MDKNPNEMSFNHDNSGFFNLDYNQGNGLDGLDALKSPSKLDNYSKYNASI